MRDLLVVCVALVAILGIVSVNLWRELHADRELIAELRKELVRARAVSDLEPAVMHRAVVEASAPQGSQPVPGQMQVAVPDKEPSAAPPAYAPPSVPSNAVVLASVRRLPTAASEEARRVDALKQSDQTARARVLAWRDQLAAEGLPLTPDQVQFLGDAAVAELRRETEESLAIDNRMGPLSAVASARLREETLSRQHDTNLRILDRAGPRLTLEQANALRDLFEAWVTPRLALAREEVASAEAAAN